jgi:hypothetical protein
VYSGTDWVPLASEVTNLSGYYTKGEIDILDAPTGLKLLVPTSVAVGSGTGTASASGTVTFSGASTVSLNGVFTSTYKNYRIVMNLHGSAFADCNVRLRASGTDLSGSVYYNTYAYARSDNGNGTGGNANQTSFLYVMRTSNSSSKKGMSSFDIVSPQTLDTTKLNGKFVYWESASLVTSWSFTGMVDNNLSYDGFSLLPSSGNITGTVSVYGYKD